MERLSWVYLTLQLNIRARFCEMWDPWRPRASMETETMLVASQLNYDPLSSLVG
jgi:hypothetical protein